MSVSICEGRTFESAIAEAAVRMSPGGIISGWSWPPRLEDFRLRVDGSPDGDSTTPLGCLSTFMECGRELTEFKVFIQVSIRW